jgi:hypothetical protein
MGKINVGRVILGGIVAGIVIDVLSYVVDGVLLAPRWAAGMQALGRTNFSSNAILGFNVMGLITGIALIWIYAAIRPRFGAGVRTAVYAGIAVWVIGALVPNASFMCLSGLFSHHLMAGTTLGAFIELIVGAIAGAAVYKESAS